MKTKSDDISKDFKKRYPSQKITVRLPYFTSVELSLAAFDLRKSRSDIIKDCLETFLRGHERRMEARLDDMMWDEAYQAALKEEFGHE